MKRFIWLQVAFVFLLSIGGYSQDPYLTAVNEGEPSSIVEGCVNALTGDFVIQQDDLVVPGTEPLILPRTYISRASGGWFIDSRFLAVHYLLLGRIHTCEKNGTPLCFRIPFNKGNNTKKHHNHRHAKKQQKEKRAEFYPFDIREDGLGVTNCAKEEVSGRFNLKNKVAFFEEGGKSLKIKQGDGTVRLTQHEYNTKSERVKTIDFQGRETTFVYDAFSHLVETHLPKVLDEEGQQIAPILKNTFDSAGRKISSTNARGETIRTSYNARNQPLQITYADGGVERFVYYPDGTLSQAFDREGAITTYTYDYDALGRLHLTKTDTL
ncbi:MAG: DUF6531 domain-containing protein, partial [Anaerolineae bacterium]